MHFRTIFAIARKDAIDIIVNKSTLVTLLMPILLAFLFVGINTLFQSKKTEILIYNPDQSGIEKVIASSFSDSHLNYAASPEQVRQAFGVNGSSHKTNYAIGLIVPPGFEQDLAQGKRPQMNLYLNGNSVSNDRSALLQGAVANYTRVVAAPAPPVDLQVATVNPPEQNANSLQNFDLGTFYAVAALMTSFLLGTTLVPGILIEEKEKKTLRMLMVSPASWADILLGKVLVVLVYQLILSLVVLGVNRAFRGDLPLVLFWLLLGSILGVSLGLLFGAIFKTTSAAGAVVGVISLVYIVPSFFIGPIGQTLGNNVAGNLIKILPTYFVAEGIYNGLTSQVTITNFLIEFAVVGGASFAILLGAIAVLRQQAAVASTI